MILSSAPRDLPQPARIRYLLLALYVASLAVIAISGYHLYTAQSTAVRQQTEAQLTSIAALKTNQIVQWQQERLSHGRVLSRNPLLSLHVRDLMQKPGAEQLRTLRGYLDVVQREYGYGQIRLADPQGNIRFALLDEVPARALPAPVAALVQETLVRKIPLMGDLRLNDRDGKPVAEVVTPILLDAASADRRVIAVLILEIAPENFLYPLLQSWPTVTASGETLLVERRGDEVLYLNDLRYAANSALRLRRPMNEPALPAAIAAGS